jgi:hypothetical protein
MFAVPLVAPVAAVPLVAPAATLPVAPAATDWAAPEATLEGVPLVESVRLAESGGVAPAESFMVVPRAMVSVAELVAPEVVSEVVAESAFLVEPELRVEPEPLVEPERLDEPALWRVPEFCAESIAPVDVDVPFDFELLFEPTFRAFDVAAVCFVAACPLVDDCCLVPAWALVEGVDLLFRWLVSDFLVPVLFLVESVCADALVRINDAAKPASNATFIMSLFCTIKKNLHAIIIFVTVVPFRANGPAHTSMNVAMLTQH